MARRVEEMQNRINELTLQLPTLSGDKLREVLNEIHSLNRQIRQIKPVYYGGMKPEEPAAQSIDERSKEELKIIASRVVENIMLEIESCQSPIERLLGMWIYYWAMARNLYEDDCFVLNPQHEIKVKNGKVFRVDFCVALKTKGQYISLVVECDGHDYHEKTKAQAQKDKSRDRLLKQAGYDVIHFTGSEIWMDPEKCAKEVIAILKEMRAGGRVDPVIPKD